MHFKSIALAATAAAALTTSGRRRRAQHARGRLVDRLSVRQDGRRASRPRQSAPRHADHRIDRHRRRLEAVLRRASASASPTSSNASRRMKASEAKLCAANGVKEVTEIQIGLDGVALATAKLDRRFRASPSATSIWRSPRPRSASPTRPRPGRTSTPSCRRFRSASTARRRPAARAMRSANC